MKRVILLVILICFSVVGIWGLRKLLKPHPFLDEIANFKKEDSLNKPPVNGILFVGSSSITKWAGIRDSFPGFPIIVRGIGGAAFPDLVYFKKEVIFAYTPRQIFIYCGDNDFAYWKNMTPERVLGRFQELFSEIRSALPETFIAYISIKPSPDRWKYESSFVAANGLIRSFLEKQPKTAFVNIHDAMLLPDGKVNEALFMPDHLHMNADGYKIWEDAVKPYLK